MRHAAPPLRLDDVFDRRLSLLVDEYVASAAALEQAYRRLILVDWSIDRSIDQKAIQGHLPRLIQIRKWRRRTRQIFH